ncbi:MAG: GTP-binding protein [Thermoplasmata archaeon]|nr:MAG: GTP-binding protein [Thermoplasmata archaeon]
MGNLAVGKTSLIRRYVFDQFSDRYKGTIGAKVSKKEIEVTDPQTKEPVNVQFLIWDITGHQSLRRLLQQAYFSGAQGIIGVCDTTREETLSDLEKWLENIQDFTSNISTVLLGNKCDLVDIQNISLNELKNTASGYEKSMAYLSSAKTGFNVELAFKTLGEKILEDVILSEF